MADVIKVFQPMIESVEEFLDRFEVQNAAALLKAGEDDSKKASLLSTVLPVNVLTDIQRRLKPTRLTQATYNNIRDNLISSYTIKKSVIGAAVNFVNRKQKVHETIEEYSKALNELASKCNYSDCCRDRLIRDVFISGLKSSKIISALISDCEEKKFQECVEKAKIIEQINQDVEDISPVASAYPANKVSPGKRFFNPKKRGKLTPKNYTCFRCGAKDRHFTSDCYAIKMKCNSCSKVGHLAKVCRANKSTLSSSNYLRPEEEDHSDYVTINNVKEVARERNKRTSQTNVSYNSLDDVSFPLTPIRTTPRALKKVTPVYNQFALFQDGDFS